MTYADASGNPLTLTFSPMYVQDVNARYVVVLFGFEELNPQYGYIVDKTTEAVFSMGSQLPIPQTS